MDYNYLTDTLQKAKEHNSEKSAAIAKIEDRLNNAPYEHLTATKRFIKVINANITARQKLINEIDDLLTILNNPLRLKEIVNELRKIDKKDNVATGIYESVVKEYYKGEVEQEQIYQP